MKWNWQEKNWPNFTFNPQELEPFEDYFLHKAGMLYGSMKHIQNDDQDALRVDLISIEAYKTSEIEGELFDRDSLHSSIGRHFGLKSETRRSTPGEQGISDMMFDLYKRYAAPLDHQTLFSWHEMLTSGRRDLIDIGQYRTHNDPMQIVSGVLSDQTVYFEAPPSSSVLKEMEAFIQWFNRSLSQEFTLSPLVRSGIAHLYFESIHPFEDGNGRIGRSISEKVLSQALNRPTLIALSQIIQSERKSYYDALQQCSVGLEITSWLSYFAQLILKAQDYSQSMIDFLIEKGKFFRRFEGKLNERQEKVVLRIFKEGIEGFKGGLSAKNYINISGATASTATRDLQRLVEIGAFKRQGDLKSTRYFLNIDHAVSMAQH